MFVAGVKSAGLSFRAPQFFFAAHARHVDESSSNVSISNHIAAS
jgi:hypothetical protein